MSFLPNLASSLPAHTGPYTVGTVDVEIAKSSLPRTCSEPEGVVPTVAFRMFYPAEKPRENTRLVRWLPQPQSSAIEAYIRFIGSSETTAKLASYFGKFFHYITISAYRNAPLLSPSESSLERWPVMIFSHGLGGSRNVYSQLLGSIASHGVVVLAIDHRDGSAAIQYVRAEDGGESTIVNGKKLPFSDSDEFYNGRDAMLKVRLWECNLIYEILLKIHRDDEVKNLDPNSDSLSRNDYQNMLPMFAGKLNVDEPGSVTWAGHSFGASTMMQLQKSVFWRNTPDKATNHRILIDLFDNGKIADQITPSSPVVLLDMWCLPLSSPRMRWLLDKPMPCYTASGPGGKAILAVLSEQCFKWEKNLKYTRKLLYPPKDSDFQGPHLFYPTASSHMAQADILVLFPRLMKMFSSTADPVRILRLNYRAILQHMRDNGIQVAPTSETDMEINNADADTAVENEMVQDSKILASGTSVQGWNLIKHENVDGYDFQAPI